VVGQEVQGLDQEPRTELRLVSRLLDEVLGHLEGGLGTAEIIVPGGRPSQKQAEGEKTEHYGRAQAEFAACASGLLAISGHACSLPFSAAGGRNGEVWIESETMPLQALPQDKKRKKAGDCGEKFREI